MDLDAIEARAHAVKDGSWSLEKVGDFHQTEWMIPDIIRDPKGTNALDFGADKALGEFVQHAREDVLALTARVRELEAENKGLRDQIDRDQHESMAKNEQKERLKRLIGGLIEMTEDLRKDDSSDQLRRERTLPLLTEEDE